MTLVLMSAVDRYCCNGSEVLVSILTKMAKVMMMTIYMSASVMAKLEST